MAASNMAGEWFSPETAVAFVGGAGSAFIAWISSRSSREAKFNARYDARFDQLEAKVAECERERPYLMIMAWGMKILVAEAQERDRGNPVLKQVATAFKALPVTENVGINDLLNQLYDIPWEPQP